jgi:hypothetical protein
MIPTHKALDNRYFNKSATDIRLHKATKTPTNPPIVSTFASANAKLIFEAAS